MPALDRVETREPLIRLRARTVAAAMPLPPPHKFPRTGNLPGGGLRLVGDG